MPLYGFDGFSDHPGKLFQHGHLIENPFITFNWHDLHKAVDLIETYLPLKIIVNVHVSPPILEEITQIAVISTNAEHICAHHAKQNTWYQIQLATRYREFFSMPFCPHCCSQRPFWCQLNSICWDENSRLTTTFRALLKNVHTRRIVSRTIALWVAENTLMQHYSTLHEPNLFPLITECL